MNKFEKMTKDEAIDYCYKHKNKFIADGLNEDGTEVEEQFECLITILEDGTIQPSQLPDHGMEY